MFIIKQRLNTFIIFLPLIWLVSGMILIPKGASYMATICIISFLYILSSGNGTLKNIKTNKFLWLIFALLLYSIFSYLYHGYSSRQLKAIFFSCLYLSVFPLPKLNEKSFFYLIALGALSITALSFYQHFYLDLGRREGHINPNVFAFYSGFFCLICFCIALTNKNTKIKALSIILFLLTATSLMFTLTRGVIIPVIAIILIPLVYYLFKNTHSKLKLIGFGLFIAISFTFIFNQFAVERYATTVSDVKSISNGKLNTSIGYRIQLWTASKHSIFKQPVFGLGDHYKDEFPDYYSKGLITKELLTKTDITAHYHNQFIDRLVKNGFVGLFILLAIIFYPAIMALKEKHNPFYSQSLASISLLTLLSSLTDSPLNHNYIVYVYLFIVFLLLSFKKDKA